MSNIILVFGSNTLGIHGAGAAKVARCEYGAEPGVGVGPTGNAYAIPTKFKPTRGSGDAVPIAVIAQHVSQFLDYARAHPDDTFLVTAIGCGLAGFVPSQIGPLFEGASENVKLPLAFHESALGSIVENRISFRF